MTLHEWSVVAASVLAGSLIALSAQAAPASGPADGIKLAIDHAGTVEKAAYRRCWWRNGRRHCRWYEGRPRPSYRRNDSDYYEHDANKLPYGTQRWWDQMLRENRAGNPGGSGRD